MRQVTIQRTDDDRVHVVIDQDGEAETAVLDPKDWSAYRKTSLTHATKIEGPFTVQTSEGELYCEDGYVAVDARGYPYPIATEEFELIYEPLEVS